MGVIELVGMRFFARHGVYPQERAEGNEFVVDFHGEADLDRASVTDALEDTIDYQVIYSVIAQEMEVPSALLEHVAGRILRRLRAEVPRLLHAAVTISKTNPPLPGPVAASKVTLSY